MHVHMNVNIYVYIYLYLFSAECVCRINQEIFGKSHRTYEGEKMFVGNFIELVISDT